MDKERIKELEAECDRIASDIAKAIENGDKLPEDIKLMRKRLKDSRHKLCDECGYYKERYLSPCPACRYKKHGALDCSIEEK